MLPFLRLIQSKRKEKNVKKRKEPAEGHEEIASPAAPFARSLDQDAEPSFLNDLLSIEESVRTLAQRSSSMHEAKRTAAPAAPTSRSSDKGSETLVLKHLSSLEKSVQKLDQRLSSIERTLDVVVSNNVSSSRLLSRVSTLLSTQSHGTTVKDKLDSYADWLMVRTLPKHPFCLALVPPLLSHPLPLFAFCRNALIERFGCGPAPTSYEPPNR